MVQFEIKYRIKREFSIILMNLNRLKYFIGIIIISFLIACNSRPVNSNQIDKSISTDQTVRQSTVVSLNSNEWNYKLKSNPGTIIDIRTPNEWQSGYINDAAFANLFDQDFISQVNKIQEDKNRPIYLYCRSGNRSKKAMGILKENGYIQIYELEKGIVGWQKEGFTITE